MGQELTVRTYHTGVVRKRILPVVLSATSARPGLSLRLPIKPAMSSSTPRLRGTSTLLSSVATPSIGPGTAVGLALLRLEHLRPDTALFTDEPDEARWKVEPWWPDWWPEKTVVVD